MPTISQSAIDLIVNAEVSSKKYYEAQYTHPEWPGGASGVTVAIGYDLGYATAPKIKADWIGRLPINMIGVMCTCSGITGSAAHSLLANVKSRIVVPWDEAIEVFDKIDMPQWINKVCVEIPGAAVLPPDCLGALVSLAYNRGSFNTSGPTRTEMCQIKSAIMAGHPESVPTFIRQMKRLWPNVNGLLVRREAEARLFEKGLRTPATQPTVTPKSSPVPPKMIPKDPKEKIGAEHGSAGGIIVATGTATASAGQAGQGWRFIVSIAVVGVIIAVITFVAVKLYRNRVVTARQKDMA